MMLNTKQTEWVSTVETGDLRCALFIKAGKGKTATMLEVVKNHPFPWFLVTRKSHQDTWHKEIAKWTDWKLQDPKSNSPLYVRTDYFEQAWVIKMVSIDAGCPDWPPDNCLVYGVIIDESYFVKGYRSKRYRMMRSICDKAYAVLIANADPVVVSVMDMWAQMRLVIGPSHLNALQMRQRFFAPSLEGFGFHEYPNAVLKYRALPDVQRHSIFYDPPSTKTVSEQCIAIELQPSQRQFYETVRRSYSISIDGDKETYQFKMAQLMRLHQICGGSLPMVTASGMSKLYHVNCGKIEWLRNFILDKQGVVIWCAYRHEALRISHDLKIPYIMGGDTTASPSDKVIVSTLDMGMSTNRFSQFPYAVYYSQNYKYFLRSQSRYRIDREDSEHENVFYYYLLCPGTIDDYIHGTIRQRGMTARKLFNDPSLKKWLTAGV